MDSEGNFSGSSNFIYVIVYKRVEKWVVKLSGDILNLVDVVVLKGS